MLPPKRCVACRELTQGATEQAGAKTCFRHGPTLLAASDLDKVSTTQLGKIRGHDIGFIFGDGRGTPRG